MDSYGESKLLQFLNKTTKVFEIVIAFMLLLVIAIKFADLIFNVAGFDIVILNQEFIEILTISFNLILGVEFVRMLYKHNTETVVYVLLFAIARQMIIYSEGMLHLLMGVVALSGMLAAKKYFVDKKKNDQ